MGKAQDNLQALKDAAKEWFAYEQNALEAEYDFLDQLGQKRGGSKTLEDFNNEKAAKILQDSISGFLGD